MKSISLFTGAGGLDLGLEAAGFSPALCVEVDRDARATLALNRPGWKLAEPGNVLDAPPEFFLEHAGLRPGEAALLAAGPVCQPFSNAARWSSNGTRGLPDQRAVTLVAALDMVEVALPQVVLLENVDGFGRHDHRGAIEYIRHRIERINASRHGNYRIRVQRLNAADFGVPQARRRLFILMDRDGREIPNPEPTHRRGQWLTAWDAIGDLEICEDPLLSPTGKWAELIPTIPEGHNYLWHTARGGGTELFGWRTRYWTFLLKLAKDQPSWTITAQPGSATGPFHWKNRRLSVTELGRLQTFPKTYEFMGYPTSQRRQIGNAVPCLLAEHVGRSLGRLLYSIEYPSKLVYQITGSHPCPPPEVPTEVPVRYSALVGRKEAHPGPGQGPGARAVTSRI
jgi:DNA (cytosine-5)-methyltransferase 1